MSDEETSVADELVLLEVLMRKAAREAQEHECGVHHAVVGSWANRIKLLQERLEG